MSLIHFLSKKLSTNRQILKNFSYLTVVQLVSMLMPFIYYPYLIRVIGAANYGQVVYGQAIMAYFIVLIQFGFAISAVKKVGDCRENTQELSKLFTNIFVIKVFFTVISFFIMNIGFVLFKASDQTINLYQILFLFCVAEVFLCQWFFQGIERLALFALGSLISKVLAMIAIFYFVNDVGDVIILAWSLGLSQLVGGVILFLSAFRVGGVYFTKIKFVDLKKEVKESGGFFFSRMSAVLTERANVTFIGAVSDYSNVAYYDLANKMLMLMQVPFTMLNQAVYPNIARTKNYNKALTVIKFALMAAFLSLFIAYFLSEWFISLYAGESMLASKNIFLILALTIPINVIAHNVGNCILVVDGRNKAFNYSILSSSALYLAIIAIFYFAGVFDVMLISSLLVFSALYVSLFRVYYAKDIIFSK